MSLPKRTLAKSQVARAGSLLGIYDGDQILDLLETGQLLPTDHYYKEKSATWIPLAELDSEPEPPPKPEPFDEAPAPSSSSSSPGSRRSKSRKKDGPALGGWIACLFALGAAAGLWAWNQNLNSSLTSAEGKVREQTALVDHLKNQIELLSELTPPGRVRAIITYEPSPETTAIVSGATIELYRRTAVDAAMKNAYLGIVSSENELFAAINRIQAELPPPLEVALTKSNGRVDIPLPEPGPYVLLTTTAKATSTGMVRFFWLIGFQSTDQPSKIILMNESNAISRSNPTIAVTEVHPVMAQPGIPAAIPPNPSAPEEMPQL